METIRECRIMTPAKINLSLDVTGEREDGYHLLATVMQSVAIYDSITVSVSETSDQKAGTINITARNQAFPCDSRNTCHKAATLFLKEYQSIPADSVRGAVAAYRKIQIHIDKNIPLAAGLGGGSADAAAVLIALNELYHSPFSIEKLVHIGGEIGADIPFCIVGGTALCKGIGDIIEPLSPLDSFPVVIVKPDFGVSTKQVFRKLRMDRQAKRSDTLKIKRPDTPAVVRDIEKKDITGLFMDTANVLESITIPEYPVIAEIKYALKEFGATGSMMSGSGPSVFGFFQTDEAALNAAGELRQIFGFESYFIQNTNTTATGPVKSNREIQ